MILPTKGIAADRALISVGADILRLTDQPKTISRVWDELRSNPRVTHITFDWFVLALDLLFLLGALTFDRGRISRAAGDREQVKASR